MMEKQNTPARRTPDVRRMVLAALLLALGLVLPFVTGQTLYYLRSYAVLFIVGFIGSTPLVKNLILKLRSKAVGSVVIAVLEPVALILLLLVCTGYLVDGSFSPFLYFRF